MDGFERRKEQSKEEHSTALKSCFSKFGADKSERKRYRRKAGVSQATIYK